MKDKVLVFIIGALVGAIITTGCFIIYEKTKTSKSNTNNQFPGENPFQMMESNGSMPTPPQKPEGDFDGGPMQMPDEIQPNENSDKTKKQKNKLQEQTINQSQETNI